MLITDTVSFDTVIHAWLAAEWKKHGYDREFPQLQYLVDSPNLGSPEENALRLQLLHATRGNLLQPIPPDTQWFLAEYEPDDLSRTYIIPSDDWLPITSGTFHMPSTLPNVASDHAHAAWIREIYDTLPNATLDTRPVLVATEPESLVTVIEGNHRIVALLKYHEDHPTDPQLKEVYIGLSGNMNRNPWHIGHPRNEDHVQELTSE